MEAKWLGTALRAAAVAAGLSAYALVAQAETPEEFYKKNNVEIVVGFNAGGGTDTAARTVTQHWTEIFGGIAKINNMPGGGTIVSANHVYRAKPDGLTLLVANFGTTLASPTLYGAPGKQFDVSKFTYIAMFADEPPAFAIAKDAPYKSLEDLKSAKGLKFGSTSAKGMPPLGSVTMLHLLGIQDGAVISGYDSAPEVGLAIKRGELQGMAFSSNSVLKENKKGTTKAMATIGYAASPLLPGVKPVNQQLKLTPEQERILKVYDIAFKTGRVILGPPGMDPAKVEYLRAKIKDLFYSPGYKATAEKVFGYWDEPVIGKDVEKLIAQVNALPKADVEEMNRLAKKYVK